jgi:hypothetical protein
VACALVTLQPGVVFAVWGGPDAAFMIGTAALWSVLAGLHLDRRWPHVGGVLVVICGLLVLNWIYDYHADVAAWARLSAFALGGVFLVVGFVQPVRHYRLIGAGVLGAEALFLGGRAIAAGPHASATLVVAAGFLLLLSGAAVSWYKRALLTHTRRCVVPVVEADGGVGVVVDEEGRTGG